MSRMTRKKLDEIRQAYHMDLTLCGCQRMDEKTGTVYACHLYVEWLVNEIEACWKERARKRAE